MTPIPVVWVSLHEPDIIARGYADQAILEALLDGTAWRPPGLPTFEHHTIRTFPRDATGAVVVIPARWHADDVGALSTALSHLSWSLIVLTGDEESVFGWRRLVGPRRRVWVQTPRSDLHAEVDGRLGDGWWPGTVEALAALDDEPRDLAWVYAGQVNNTRREECVRVLAARRDSRGDGRLRVTSMFGSGMPRDEYVAHLAAAKVAPCPSGSFSPDSFRVFEALEAGCVPVVDSGTDRACGDYWTFLFGGPPPFPVLDSWAGFDAVCDRIVAEWPAAANRCGAWWLARKRDLARRLVADLRDVGAVTDPVEAPDDLITVLVPVSPIPSHPDTRILDETVASIRLRLPAAEIILMIDGVRAEQAHRRRPYAEFVRRVVRRCGREWSNVLPVVFDEHLHQAAMTARTLPIVDTPTILFVEQDTPLVGDVDWPAVVAAVRSGAANVVRFHHEAGVHPEHEHLMLDTEPRDVEGAPLLRTAQWSQRPHLASTAFYETMTRDYFGAEARSFIEDVMHGVVHNAYRLDGEAGWEQFRVWLYAPPGDIKRSTHTDGRAGEDKYPQVWAYDGPTPPGAPNPRTTEPEPRRPAATAKVRWGIFGARGDRRGLAAQTATMAQHLHPDRVLGLDMGGLSPFEPAWDEFDPTTLTVVPVDKLTETVAAEWLTGLDVVVGCETFYRPWFTGLCRRMGVRTVLAPNPEFFAHVDAWDPHPDVLAPATGWRLDHMPGATVTPLGVDRTRFPFRLRTRVESFLLVVGHPAAHDRNGALAVFDALRLVAEPTHVIVRSQSASLPIPSRYPSHVHLEARVGDVADRATLYDDGDVLLLPRRYGGLSLPLMEALSCGLPVLMTDADPQRTLLPAGMLIPSYETRRYQGQSGVIPLADADVPTLAARMDALSRDAAEVERLSKEADLLAESMSWEHVAPRWFDLLDHLCEGLAG